MTTDIENVFKTKWHIENTETWLINLWRSENWLEADADKLLQLLSCMLICAEEGRHKQALDVIEEVCDYINSNFQNKIQESNPLLFTMTNHLLNRQGRIPTEVFQEGEMEIKKGLVNIPKELKEDERIFFLMDRYNLVDEEQSMSFVRRKIIDDTRFLLLDSEKMKQQLYLWFISTSLGEKKELPPDLKKSSENLEILFSGCLLAECQTYQLELISLLLRTMSYLSYDSELLNEGVDFLCFQQRSNGAYGYLNPFTVKANQIPQNIDMDFYLPMLYEILWALSDVTRCERRQ